MKKIKNALLILTVLSFIVSCGSQDGVYFENLEEGQTVTLPLIVKMGVKGMEVEPAGVINKGKGHHHILIDGNWLKTGEVVPANDQAIHYGKGQIEATLTDKNLSSGEHTLTLQFANGLHQSYGEGWSKTIKINVE